VSVCGKQLQLQAAISACKELKAGPVYPCSKAALDMLTKSCAVEFGPHGIRVNSVNPTLMDTYLVAALSSEMKANGTKLIERSPMRGILAPEDAADLVLYLSSTCSKMITGSAVPVDGGYLAC
jgi:L-xylulose reductase